MRCSFQQTIIDILKNRLNNACAMARKISPKIKYFVVSGGVAANTNIRLALEKTARHNDLIFYAPKPQLCTDNGIMVASSF